MVLGGDKITLWYGHTIYPWINKKQTEVKKTEGI